MSHLRPTCRCHSGLNPVLLILGKDVSFGPSCNVCSCMNSYSTSILSSYRFIILAVRIFILEGSRQVTYKPFLLQVIACRCVRLVGRTHRPLSRDSRKCSPCLLWASHLENCCAVHSCILCCCHASCASQAHLCHRCTVSSALPLQLPHQVECSL